MSEHIGQQTVDNSLKTLNSASELLEKILGEMSKLVKSLADTKLEKQLSRYLENGGIPGHIRADKYADELHKRLEEENIPHIVSRLKDGYGAYVIFKAADIDRIDKIRDEILLEKGELSETSLADLKRANYGKKLGVIENLDNAQLNTLREKTGWLNGQHNKTGWDITTIAFEKQKDGLNRVYFREVDAPKINIAYSKMSWELTGRYGEKIREQEEYDVKQRQDIMAAVRAGLKDVCIVSAQDTTDYIKLTDDGYVACHGEFEEARSKTDPAFERDLLEHLERMQVPITLKASEFALDSDQRDNLIAKRNKRPYVNKHEREIFEKERKMRELVEQKMLQYNSDQPENLSSLYNGDVSLNEYMEHELVNEEHSEEEISQIKTHFSEYIRQMSCYSAYQIDVDEKDLDTIINDTQNSREEQKEENIEEHELL